MGPMSTLEHPKHNWLRGVPVPAHTRDAWREWQKLPHRSLWQVLKGSPVDWILQRTQWPNDLALLAMIPALLGGPAGSALALLIFTKVPTVVTAVRVLAHRKPGYVPPATGSVWGNRVRVLLHRDITYWTRAESKQSHGLLSALRPPLETQPTTKDLPPGVRALTLRAEKSTGWTARGGRIAHVADDWVNQRARYPRSAIEYGLLGASALGVGVPFQLALRINLIARGLPRLLSYWIGFANGQPLRAMRPGVFQRPDMLARQEKERSDKDAAAPTMQRAVREHRIATVSHVHAPRALPGPTYATHHAHAPRPARRPTPVEPSVLS